MVDSLFLLVERVHLENIVSSLTLENEEQTGEMKLMLCNVEEIEKAMKTAQTELVSSREEKAQMDERLTLMLKDKGRLN